MTLPDESAVTVIHPDREVDRNLLVPGCIVWRYTEPASAGRARAPLPCHEDQTVFGHPQRISLAVCRICSTAFDLELHDEGDGGYAAHFTVIDRAVLLSRARHTAMQRGG